jgi:hypothetical protein
MNPDINPLAFNYGMDTTAVVPFAKPTAIIVTGRGNRYDAAFQEARKRGALVPAYWNPINIPVGATNAEDLEQWMRDTSKVPRWRFNGTGPVRSNWANTELADIRPGSAWRKYFRTITQQLIERDQFDGFFCDDLGIRPWGANWEDWPVAEQMLWAECMLDIAREIHELRVTINRKFEIYHNNLWHLPASHPAAAMAVKGDQYCNGVCLENTPPDKKIFDATGRRTRAQFHINYAARTFAPGFPRRLLVIHRYPEMFEEWKEDPNVTHLALVNKDAGQDYMKVTPARVPYKNLSQTTPPPPPPNDCERRVQELSAAIEALRTENDQLKRVSSDQRNEIAALRDRVGQIATLAKL